MRAFGVLAAAQVGGLGEDPFTPTNALTTLLTVESLVFSVLNVALALSASTSLPRRARPEARLLALSSAALVTVLGLGAAAAWWRLFADDWPSRLDEQLPVVCLAAGIAAQPIIACTIAWLQARRPRWDGDRG